MPGLKGRATARCKPRLEAAIGAAHYLRMKILLAIAAAFALAIAAPAWAAASQTAVFSGGCFWSMQHDMEHIPGVVSTEVGYTGGHVDHPTYEEVSSETTGHLESIKVTFDPAKISYAALVQRYWHLIDPTDAGGAFCDRGASYHSAIFVNSPDQRRIAEASKAALENGALKGKIVTPIRDAVTFWPAEDYHQHYADKNVMAYGAYRFGCGKDGVVKRIWGPLAFR
jgi:peptide-methionine (S)-S-oxide reductase